MFVKTFGAIATVSAAVVLAQGSFQVDTPMAASQCEPLKISWHGGSAPYYPKITQPGNTAEVIKSFPQSSDTSITWSPTINAGSKFTIAITDSSGQTASSAQVTVGQGSSSCSGDSGSSSSGASSSSSGGSGGGAAAAGGSGGSGNSSGSGSKSKKSSSSSSGGGDSSSSSDSGSGGSSSDSSMPTSSGGDSMSSSGGDMMSSAGGDSGAAGGASSADSGSSSKSGASTFSGFPAVVAGVVGVAVAALM